MKMGLTKALFGPGGKKKQGVSPCCASLRPAGKGPGHPFQVLVPAVPGLRAFHCCPSRRGPAAGTGEGVGPRRQRLLFLPRSVSRSELRGEKQR